LFRTSKLAITGENQARAANLDQNKLMGVKISKPDFGV
jgi:hypothetical protein